MRKLSVKHSDPSFWASRPVWLIDEPESGTPSEAPRTPRTPFKPSAPIRTEYHPTRNAVALKRAGRRERMLERLKSGPCGTWELMMLGGAGFSSRIRELRDAGHRIVCDEGENGATYTLVQS